MYFNDSYITEAVQQLNNVHCATQEWCMNRCRDLAVQQKGFYLLPYAVLLIFWMLIPYLKNEEFKNYMHNLLTIITGLTMLLMTLLLKYDII